MKKEWSKSWIKSRKPGKQRKYRGQAPLHVMNKFLGCHLSKELREKYKTRSVPLRVGDKVKVMTGQFKGKTGKIEGVDLKKGSVHVAGIELIKKEGSKRFLPLDPSNLIITELKIDDNRRLKNITGAKKHG